jgi:hypothetical protein
MILLLVEEYKVFIVVSFLVENLNQKKDGLTNTGNKSPMLSLLKYFRNHSLE